MTPVGSEFHWIVAQEGSRRNYSVPVAFRRSGGLRLFYTDIWCRYGRTLLKNGPKPARALAGRFNGEIPEERVISFTPTAVVRRSARYLRVGPASREEMGHFWCDFGQWFDSCIERHLRNVELDPNQNVFFGFNTNCLEVIQMLRKRGIVSVVNQVDPARVEEDLVLAESERWPNWERARGRLPQRYWDRLSAEWEAASLVAVNSEWTRQALFIQGVPAEKIFVVQPAVDLKLANVSRHQTGAGPLRVLWLGSVILRKGIQYLAEAARLLRSTDIKFLIAGEVGISRQAIASFPANMKMLGRLPRKEALALYSAADVLVLPTLSDGFAITQLEAMAHGLPVVTTPNCGKVVTDGVDGFIVPPRNSQALADVLARLHFEDGLLREMSRQAQLKVQQFNIPSNVMALNHVVREFRRRSGKFSRSSFAPVVSRQPAQTDPHFMIERPSKLSSSPASSWQRAPERLSKAVVGFSGSRDFYQVPWALEESGLLQNLVTDFYWDLPRLPMGAVLGKKFPKLLARFCPGLPSDRVTTPFGATARTLLMRSGFASVKRQIKLDRLLGRTARDLAWRSKAALFSYSYYAAAAFAPGNRRPAMRFLFQLHPHPAAVREILQEEMQRAPRFAASLKWEHEIGAPEAHFQSLCAEPQLANGWVVASSFTARTLADHGIPLNEIHVVPYGVNARNHPCRDSAPGEKAPFRVIWIGSMLQRKGLSYFLEAIGSLPQENLEVMICGYHAVDRAVIEEYGIRSVRVFRGLPTAELTRLLRSCDLFVLPSLAEGFGHVILEAMASGVPVLTTSSTCAPDVLEDGVHGFIIPIRDPAAIASRITWGRKHRSELYQMGLAAAVQARTFTWERFRSRIVAAYSSMVQSYQLRMGSEGRNQSVAVTAH